MERIGQPERRLMGGALNMGEWLLATGRPEAVALIHGKVELSYAALIRQADRVSRHLLASGCGHQDRVGIWAENGPFFVAAYLGILRAGLVAVPLPTEGTAQGLLGVARDAGMRCLLTSRRHLATVRAWLEGTGIAVVGEEELSPVADGEGALVPARVADTDLAALMFTSGSTGKPKGVMVSHRNIGCNTRDIIGYLGLTAADRAMVVLPFHYCYGLSVLHSHLAVGASVVVNNQFMYPESVLQEMQVRGCTGLAGVPSTYQILLRKSRFRELRFPDLRWLQQAGGKLPNACIRELMEAFPQVRLFVMYGQTEATARLSYLPPDRLIDKLGSVGRGLASTRLEVLRPDGTPVPPGSDEVGEIVASGENIAAGYWNDPEETARFFRGGRLWTGDLARVDAEGFIYIVEREREMIKSGGNRVSAKEVEDVIAELGEVVEVAVVGVPHPILGEAILAFVVPAPRSGLTVEMALHHCRSRLPLYKLPGAVRLMPSLPHNAAGKVLKAKLREMAAEVGGEIATAQV